MTKQEVNAQKITEEEIQHVADLARIEISEEEKKKYASEMSAILGYISQLNEVDTDDVSPTTQVTGLINVTREDESFVKDAKTKTVNRKKILECAPLTEENYIKVKSVF